MNLGGQGDHHHHPHEEGEAPIQMEENDAEVVQIREVEWEWDVVVVRVWGPYPTVEADLIGGGSQRPEVLSHVTPYQFHLRPSYPSETDGCIQMTQNAYLADSQVHRVPFALPSPSLFPSPHPLRLGPAVGTEALLLLLDLFYRLCHRDVAHLCTGLKSQDSHVAQQYYDHECKSLEPDYHYTFLSPCNGFL